MLFKVKTSFPKLEVLIEKKKYLQVGGDRGKDSSVLCLEWIWSDVMITGDWLYFSFWKSYCAFLLLQQHQLCIHFLLTIFSKHFTKDVRIIILIWLLRKSRNRPLKKQLTECHLTDKWKPKFSSFSPVLFWWDDSDAFKCHHLTRWAFTEFIKALIVLFWQAWLVSTY